MNIAFFVRHFTERGTEVAIYDYAHHNEKVLNNKSYIICFTPEAQKSNNFPPIRHSYEKFRQRFTMVEIDSITDMSDVIKKLHISFFYTLTHGGKDIYKFDDGSIWGNCKTIKHCVFDTKCLEGDFHISISNHLNNKLGTTLDVIPHMVDCLPPCHTDMREELKIPKDAIVYGRHGGNLTFNILAAHDAIKEHILHDDNCNAYFLLMNTDKFFTHPRIIHLPMNTNLDYKAKFINTCDVMLHARQDGETFGLSIGEFSLQNKPIITCPCGDREHILILGEKAITYESKSDLLSIFRNIKEIINSRSDWNAFERFSPKNVMKLFDELIFNKKE